MIPHKCPVCEGQGTMLKPTHIPGDQKVWYTNSTKAWPCKPCSGSGIIWGHEAPHG